MAARRKRLCTWTGEAGDGFWTTAGNWSTEATPQEGEVVQLGTGAVTLTNSTPQLAAVEIASTLAMSNWTACVRATTVTVANGGKVTVAGLSTDQATNRVWIVCDDCTIAAGGSHGGKSGGGTWSSAAQRPYDDEYLPTMPGSGGGNGSWAADASRSGAVRRGVQMSLGSASNRLPMSRPIRSSSALP